jgi:hypothetical protein
MTQMAQRMKARPERGSPIRSIVALVSLVGALVALPAGGLQMVRTLERGGYGTSSIDYAVALLGLGGGLLGLGIALLIWEISVRQNWRH